MNTQKWFVNGNWRVGLFAVQDIPKGKSAPSNNSENIKTGFNCMLLLLTGLEGSMTNLL